LEGRGRKGEEGRGGKGEEEGEEEEGGETMGVTVSAQLAYMRTLFSTVHVEVSSFVNK